MSKNINQKIKCSVGILTFNSGKTLERALESVKIFNEIIICDGGSVDDTLKIAKKYNCKIILQNKKFKNEDGSLKNYSGVRNQCLDSSQYDWFLYIDSDESISLGLEDEIREVVESHAEFFIYDVPIAAVIGSKIIKYSSNYPGYQNRFFNKKSGARFFKEVHEKIKYSEKEYRKKRMNNPWYVYWTEDRIKNYSKYFDKYINLEVSRNKNVTFFSYLRYGVFGNLIIALKVLIKSSRNYLLHGFKYSMPVTIEIQRINYPLLLMTRMTIDRFKK